MSHRWDPVCRPPYDLVTPVRRAPAGAPGPTRSAVRGDAWRQTSRGFHVPAHADRTRVEQRIVEHAVRLGPTGAVSGWAALRLAGAAFCDGLAPDGATRLPVLLLAGDGRLGPGADAVVSRARLDESEVVWRCGVRCTIPERAVLDQMWQARDEVEAVVVLDMAMAARLTSQRRFAAYLGGRRGSPAMRLAAVALDRSDEHSHSPQETRLRDVWTRVAGRPRPLTNRAVRDLRGRFLGIPDLLDPDAGVIGEYNGADHRGLARQARDEERQDLFRRAGLEVVPVVGVDLRDHDRVVERIDATWRRAGQQPRGWTVDPPEWDLDVILDRRDALARLRRES